MSNAHTESFPAEGARVLLALSGGVDSAVALLQLKERGYDVAAAYMKNWINENEILGDCPWQEDIEDARKVCAHLGVDFEVGNFIADYKERVVAYLVDGYRRGLTPNPDVLCNREMKFGVFLDWAREQGFDAVATGHYCQRVKGEDGLFYLAEGADANKDQSYFLALCTQAQAARAAFPVGHLPKPEVRALAREAGLPNAGKKDSQGICFIGEVNIRDFLEQYIPQSPGEIVNLEGTVVGEHLGLHRYTLGQRKGIGVPSNADNEFYVVVGKDYESNRLLVAFESPDTPGLWQTSMRLRGLSWIGAPVREERSLLAKPRYRDPSVSVTFTPTGTDTATVTFTAPQRALAPGQVCALYDGPTLLGGGVYY